MARLSATIRAPIAVIPEWRTPVILPRRRRRSALLASDARGLLGAQRVVIQKMRLYVRVLAVTGPGVRFYVRHSFFDGYLVAELEFAP